MTIAAVNSPASTVISGPPGQVAAVVAAARDQGLRTRIIDVDYASHGPQVGQITAALAASLHGITPAPAAIPFYSAVTGRRTDGTALDAAYWITSLRQPVRFADTITTLLTDGYKVFIEASPHPVLTPAIEETADASAAHPGAAPAGAAHAGAAPLPTRSPPCAATTAAWPRSPAPPPGPSPAASPSTGPAGTPPTPRHTPSTCPPIRSSASVSPPPTAGVRLTP